MNLDNRPYIEFERVVNKGVTAREARKNEKGEVTRGAHPGEFKEIWRKSLVSHLAPFAPYCWVTSEWVNSQLKRGRLPVGFGNLDKLPESYPAEWKKQLYEAVSAIQTTINANKAIQEQKAQLEAANAELVAKLKAAEEKLEQGSKDEQGKSAESGKQTKSGRQSSEPSKVASGEAGQAANG